MKGSAFALRRVLMGVVISIMLPLTLTPGHAIEPSPFNDPGTLIAVRGGNLPSLFEPSGSLWHSRLQRVLIVDDGGQLAMMDSEGENVVIWQLGNSDLEGICLADSESDFVYIGVEQNPISIQEFNLTTGQVTRVFDLEPWLSGYGNEGLEGLTFISNNGDAEGGRFYVGIQATGEIFIFSLPILSSFTDNTVTFVGNFTPENQMQDLSGLYYCLRNDILYGIYDSFNVLVAMNTDGTSLKEWQLPGNDQEGFAIGDNGLVYVAEDVDEVWRYQFARLPEANAGEDCIVTDSDGDGIYSYTFDGSGSIDALEYRWF
ncbi:MAG: hypothetical protein JSV14_08800 [Deltaproteobacteria bacterium]|nr:MAG: hypothetical protein JSV14_08800 [Deltaproteobacteria bacterium]